MQKFWAFNVFINYNCHFLILLHFATTTKKHIQHYLMQAVCICYQGRRWSNTESCAPYFLLGFLDCLLSPRTSSLAGEEQQLTSIGLLSFSGATNSFSCNADLYRKFAHMHSLGANIWFTFIYLCLPCLLLCEALVVTSIHMEKRCKRRPRMVVPSEIQSPMSQGSLQHLLFHCRCRHLLERPGTQAHGSQSLRAH